MAVGTGYGFDLEALNSAINDAEKKFKKLTTTGVNTARAIDEAFKLAANGGLKQFRNGIAGLDAALKGKGADKAIKDIGTSAVDSANKITQLVESIRGGGERFTDLMARINDRGAYNPKNGALESVNAQLDEQWAKLKELKDLLNFYAKGEGLKAVDTAVHPKEYIEAKEREAEATMRLIEKLEQEKKERESLARLQRELAKRQGGIDADYEPRLLEYTQGYKHRMQMESTYAKYSSKLYEDTYNEQIRSYEQLWDKVEKSEKNRDERIAKQKIAEYKATMSEMMALDKAMYSSQKEGKANTAEYDAIEARYKKLVDRKLALEAELDKRVADLKEKADVRNKAEEQKRAIQSGKEQQRIADKASKEAIAKARQTEKEKLALYKSTLTEMKSLDKNIYRVDTKGTDAEKAAIAETRNRYKELEAQKTALEAELGRKTTDIRKKFEAEVESETAKRLIRERELREAENKRALQEAKANAKQQAAENKRAENEKIATYRATLAELKSLDKDRYAIESKGKQVQEADKYQKILDRERDLNTKKLDLENQLGSKVNEIRRRFDTERLGEIAKRHIREIELEEKAADNAAKASSEARRKRYQEYITSYEGAMRTSQRASTKGSFADEEQAIKNLEAARDRLKKSDADYAVKLNALNEAIKRHEKNLKDATKTDKDRADEAAKNAKKIADAQAKYDSISRRERYKAYTTSYEGAIRTSDRAKTLAQEIQAIKNLEAARAKLNRTDADYQKKLDNINARILQHNKNIAQATAGAKDLQKAHSKLGTTIASVFSIQAIRGYINQMIKVRGEMELQQRSLQAILQNKDAANEVWQKTIDLAVRSPFRIKDLVTYTKQLAAYRVESEKLYDTNKMLADVSAGLGVDMQRLILAFGQVKSANFLRGTELRQFTEAGIPMLDELAKLYTQMEGALVTSGDVFERISKRMVLFEDVEEVFKRMTAAGGTFYRMQEIQSETLKGQISNLKDSVDIMLNSMGKDMDGVLKKSVKSVKFLVDNYEVLIPILKSIIVALALYKVNSFAASEATLRMARSMKMAKISATGLGGAWTSLRVGLAQFGKSLEKTTKMLASNPWLLLAAAIVTAAIKLNQFRKELEEVDKKYSQLLDKQGDVYLAFRQAGQKSDLEEQVAERRKQLQALVDMAKNEYGLVIDINVGEIDESNLEEEFNKIRQKMIELNAFSASFSKEMIKSDKLSKWADLDQFGVFEEGLFEDIQDLGGSYEKLYQEMINKSGRTVETLRDKWNELTDAQQKAVEDLEKPIQGDEILVDYVNRLKDAYTTLLELKDVKNNKISRFIRSFNRDVREANAEFKLFANRFREEVNGIADEKEKIEFLDVSIGAMANEKKWSEFEENYIRRLVEQEFEITFVPKTATPEELKNWQKSYNALFKGDSGFREITAPATSQSQVIERLKGTYQSLEETIKRIEAAGKDSVLAGGAYEGQDLNKLKSDLAEVKRQLDWFGVENKTGGGSGKDEVLEKLKNRISLIKEMNKEYEKLNKTFSKAESLAKVQKAYADTAKELGLDTSTMDFTDEGTIKSLEALLGKPEYAANKYVIELQKALDNFNVELGIEVKKGKDQELLNEVQDMFDQYDLSLELKKLNIPPDLAKSLFGIESINLSDIREKVQGELDSAKAAGGQEDRVAQLEKDLEKINDMEDKAQVERLKTYLKYTRDAIGERAKIKVEEMNKLMEIEETFNKASSKAKTEEDKKRIEEQRKLAIAGVQKESSDKTRELDWDAFRSSDTFVAMFQDLDRASDDLLNHAITKIREFQDQWTDMPISDAKEMINKLNELEMALLDTGRPFEDYRKANQDIENAMIARQIKPDAKSGKSQQALREDIGAENKEMEDIIANSERVVALLEIINNANAETKQAELEKLGINKDYVESLGLSADVLTNSVEANNDIIRDEKQKAKDAQKNIGLNQKVLNQLNKQKNRLEEQADAIGKAQQMANDLYEAFSELAEALGADKDSPAAIFADMGMNMLNTVLNTIQLQLQLQAATIAAHGLGAAMNAAMGVVGWIVMAIQLLAQVITAIVQANDKKIDAQVERLRAQVEELEKRYDKLSETIDEVYSTAELEEVSRKLDEIYYKEKRALEQAIAARKADKNISDDEWDEIAEMEQELIDLEEKHTKSMKEIVSNATDGILDSVKDAARDFTDAWYDAFVETGKGINGLEENFNEMFMNLAKQQASMQITQAFVDKWKRDLSKYVDEKDTTLTPEEAAAWANEVKATFPELSNALEAFLGVIHESVGGLQSGELSSLQKGTHSLSESTGQVIESLLNSLRFYVADSNSELKSQTKYMRDMYNMLSNMTASHAQGGRGIKVVM